MPGIRVTARARTIVDLATTQAAGRVGVVLDDELAAGRVDLDRVAAACRDAIGRGRRVRDLVRLLDERSPGAEPGRPVLEAALRRVLRSVAGGPPRHEAPFPGRELPGRAVDALFVAERVVVEADGRRWHTRLADFRRDRERDRAAARAGHVVVRYTFEELTGSPETVARELSDVLRQRRADLGRPSTPAA